MLARRYETRLDEDGLITFEKVWSKRINIHVEKNEFKHPEHIYELCKALRLDTYSEEHAFLLMFDTKMHFKSFIEIGVGSVNASVIDRRGIAQKVLMLNATACPTCDCIFTYQREDIAHKQTGIIDFKDFVICPDCGEECGVKSYD